MKMAKQKIDEETRQKVCTAHASGIPMRKIAKEYGISLSSVSRVVNEKSPQKIQSVPKKPAKKAKSKKTERQKKIEELERKIAELEKKVLEVEDKRKALKK
jgi:transposase